MHTYTHEKLPLLPFPCDILPEKHRQILSELDIPEEEMAATCQVLEQLDTIHCTPRPATVTQVLKEIRRDSPVIK